MRKKAKTEKQKYTFLLYVQFCSRFFPTPLNHKLVGYNTAKKARPKKMKMNHTYKHKHKHTNTYDHDTKDTHLVILILKPLAQLTINDRIIRAIYPFPLNGLLLLDELLELAGLGLTRPLLQRICVSMCFCSRFFTASCICIKKKNVSRWSQTPHRCIYHFESIHSIGSCIIPSCCCCCRCCGCCCRCCC